MASATSIGILCIAVLWVANIVLRYRKLTAALKTIPSNHILLSPNSLFWGNVLSGDEKSSISKGGMYPFKSKRTDYNKSGWNVFAMLAPLPSPDSVIWVSDAAVTKQITGDRKRFPKPLERYAQINVFGKNVISTEGDEWKKHRKISQPAFSEKNNRLVWDTAAKTVNELIDEVWDEKAEVKVNHITDVTLRVALMVLSVAGFGKDMTWKGDAQIPPGHTMTFTRALELVSTNLAAVVMIPKWARLFGTAKLREVNRSKYELESYMDELIKERMEECALGGKGDGSGPSDLLTNLIKASSEDAGSQLTPSEIRGNTFVYLIAGHESTAHTLTYLFGLLALYPDEQEKLYQHTKSIVGSETHPTYDDFEKFDLVLAAFNETLRLFPAVTTIAKKATEDTIFKATAANPKSDATRDMVVPANTWIYVHTPGLHYNPRYWEDPYVFKPERFLGDWNKDAFLPFSGGPRGCIGRKFSEVEGVAATVALLLRYSIHLTPEQEAEYEKDGLTTFGKAERLLQSFIRITLTPIEVPLLLKKRT